ncbi:MAG: CTP synthase [Blastochloris viridis]|uniref:CTP synthase n=1 Tax=Blastochloris viridis TaxID=1079 RepID=A0A6N4RD61_BLAVI|nr:MAG: CTP synthase [Blastochloris viridis]
MPKTAQASPQKTKLEGGTRYIFVTGGVMSSLGKGLTASALAAVLQARGFSVAQQKLDPYLNVDPGTMSPFQHGEVYVTDDGAETDLDLGHYERFTGVPTGKFSNITAGQIYWNILHKERKGDYLGKTVQVVPHVTNEIKAFVKQIEGKADFALIEIGGTVGDIESMAFIEAIRQMGRELRTNHGSPNRACFMHLTFAPYLKAVGEVKTKPTQNAVRDLLEMGIQADVVVVRSEVELDRPELDKIAMFAGLPSTHVVNCPDSDTIYRVPVTLHNHGLDSAILDHFGIEADAPDLSRWQHVSHIASNPPKRVKIAVVGKYVQLGDAYKSLNEALIHGGFAHDALVDIDFVDSEALEKCDDAEVAERLKDAAGILIPGGFGARGTEGKIRAITYARENKKPFFGICLGLQMAIAEYARNKAGVDGADSTEFTEEKGAPANPIICQMTEWQKPDGSMLQREAMGNLGGTMRLGAYPAKLKRDSLAAKVYGMEEIMERHRHRYEFNPRYRETLEAAGLVFSGLSPQENALAEIVELPVSEHPFFIAVQYHPEFKSQPLHPHPIFAAFVDASLKS